MLAYISGIFLGWSLGANDSANVFGTAVSSRMISYRKAIILISIFVIFGAVVQGTGGVETLRSLSNQTSKTAGFTTLAAALCVTVMTIMKIPVSTSQAVGGAIFGVGLLNDSVNYKIFTKMVICWIATPFGGALMAIVLYYICGMIFKKLQLSIYSYDSTIKVLLIVCGCYGAYSLGANNVGNVAAVFVGEEDGMLSAQAAVMLGSCCIAFGTITYSKRVMMTVGKGIIKLDAFTAFICVLSHSVTLHIFAEVGVPVSSSQAVVGSILGIGFIKGLHVINYKTLFSVLTGWVATPFVGAGIAILLLKIFT